MAASKTRILDATINALSHKESAKRAPRKAQITIDVNPTATGFTIQVNGRVRKEVVAEELDTYLAVTVDGLKALGWTVHVNRY